MQVKEDPSILNRSLTPEITTDFVVAQLTHKGNFCWLVFDVGQPFACFSAATSASLKRLAVNPCVQLDCMIYRSPLDKAVSQWKKSGKGKEFVVDLNVYGHEHSARVVGDMLADARLFLQFPKSDNRGLVYDNPQYLKLPNVASTELFQMNSEIAQKANPEEPKEVSASEIEILLDHIPQPKFLRHDFSHTRILTPLIE